MEWLYDLHVRKVKKCRIQPVGSRRQTRASSARATDKAGRGHANAASRSQHASSHTRTDKQQSRPFFTELSRGSSHGRRDHNRRRGNDDRTGMGDVGRGSGADVLPGRATSYKPGHVDREDTRHVNTTARVDQPSTLDTALVPGGRKSPRGNVSKGRGAVYGDVEVEPLGRSVHTHAGRLDSFSPIPDIGVKLPPPLVVAGRGIHVAPPLSLGRPRSGSSHGNVGAVRGSMRSADGQYTREGAASLSSSGRQSYGERRSPSVDSSRSDDDLLWTSKSMSPKSVTSLDMSPVRDAAAPRSNLLGEVEHSVYTGRTATGNDIMPSASSPVDIWIGNDDSVVSNEYNVLNQTDSDVIIEESESEDNEEWT